MYGHCFIIKFFVTFLVVQSSCIEERAGCFTFCSCCRKDVCVLSFIAEPEECWCRASDIFSRLGHL